MGNLQTERFVAQYAQLLGRRKKIHYRKFFSTPRPTNSMTKGQVQDSIVKRVIEFYVTTLGTGPREARVYIIEDMVVVRLKGKLLPIEEQLLAGNKGVELVKNIRKALHEINTKQLNSIIEEVTGHTVVSTHSDISTKTGERFEAFILDTNFEKGLEEQNKK